MKDVNWNNVVSAVATEHGLEVTERQADGTIGAPVMMRAANPNHFAAPAFVAPGGTQPRPVQTAGDLFMFQVFSRTIGGSGGYDQHVVATTSGERMVLAQARVRAAQLLSKYGKCPAPAGQQGAIVPCCSHTYQTFEEASHSGPPEPVHSGQQTTTYCVLAYRYVNNQWAHAYDVAAVPDPVLYSSGMKF